MTNACQILAGKAEWETQLGRPKYGWKNNIKWLLKIWGVRK
jgi:hypothetical protein